ncbi:hypothetical protein CBER1_10670 [Cercospora berteroae]|uniref:Uncharacterized protein n=1 Tax=Cercospora berteroae TaxID=357750 RepID=A0A2S6CMY7_9PEZI|nr:hypothetical protein CBER1_10670 [Cercospora berteroae]
MSGVLKVPATLVFGWGTALVSFDSKVGYGENDNISIKVMILERTKGLVVLSVKDDSISPPGCRKLAIPLEKCFSIEPEYGLLFNDVEEPAAGVFSKRVWYGHREKQYRYLDLRIMGIPEELKWKGTPLEKMSYEAQAIIADYEKYLELDFLVLTEATTDMPRIDEFIRICKRIQDESDRNVAMQARGINTTSTAEQDEAEDQEETQDEEETENQGETEDRDESPNQDETSDQDETPEHDIISIADDDDAAVEDIPEGEQDRERSRKFKKNLATMLVDMASMVKELLTSDMNVTEEMTGASVNAVRALQELARVTKEASGGS